jgi:multiple sugar transport system substrate-binding protein
MNKKLVLLLAILFLAVAALVLVLFLKPKTVAPTELMPTVSTTVQPSNAEKVKLVYAVHWTEKFQTDGIYENGALKEKGLKQYLDEYTALHPEVEFEIMTIPYTDYEKKLQLLDSVDAVPDIFQIYSPWGVSYVKKGMIAAVPEDIQLDVKNNYVSQAGVTIDGQIWGIPGEVNDFSLIYNKRLFKEAGIIDGNGEALAPATWADLVKDVQKTSKKDASGNITQYGFAFTKGMDWAVVDPFLSLLLSNGGGYLATDNSQAIFNSPEGVEVLKSINTFFTKGYTDVNSNVWDFSKEKVAMAFIAPWTEGVFKEALGDKFNQEVGVAPIPYFKQPGSLQYSWFLGVMDKSKNKQATWDFLRWFTTEIQPERGTTRYGDLMARTIKAIPSRKVDLENNKDVLENNFFKAPFISQLGISTPEPNVLRAAEMKEILRTEIEATWAGKDVKQALDDAAFKTDAILKSNVE